MTPTLISLISLTLGFLALVIWVWNPRNRTHWDEASRLPFESDEAEPSDD